MRLPLLGAFAALSTLLAGSVGCGPPSDCAATASCAPPASGGGASSSTSANGGSGGATSTGGAGGTTSSTGGSGGMAPTCNNDKVDPGEICFDDPPQDYATTKDGPINDLVLSDCDMDGHVDVILIADNAWFVRMKNDSKGVFSSIVDTSVNWANQTALAVGQLDGKAGDDIAMTSSDSAWNDLFYYSGGCGYTLNVVYHPMGNGLGTPDVAVANINNAGPDDWVSIGSSRILWQLDSPQAMIGSTDSNLGEAALVSVDLTGDSRADIAWASVQGSTVRTKESDGLGLLSTGQAISVGKSPVAIAAGVLTSSGFNDVVVANRDSDSVSVLINDGSGVLSRLVPDPQVGAQPCALALGDIDGDGDQDVVTANCIPNTVGTVSILLNDGSGKLVASESVPPGFPHVPSTIALADLNGDGALDIVVGHSSVVQGSSHITVLLATP